MNKYLNMTDEELIIRSIEEQECFAELFERYEDTLIRYIQRISNVNHDQAQEILQNSFIKVWKNIHNFDTSLKFSNWIYRITHNETINYWKKERKHLKNQYMGELDIQDIGERDNTINILIQKADNQYIKNAINSLPIKYKNVLILKYWEQKEYHEIAEILKKPKNTIGTLIRRAKLALKEILESSNE